MVNSELNYTELRLPPPSNSHPVPRVRATHTNYAQVIPQDLPPAPEPDTLSEGIVNPVQDIEEPIDPFSDGSNAVWDDPESFYDRPPPARPIVQVGQGPEEGVEGQRDAGETADTTGDDDCTGGSAYMDTSQFLRTKAPVLCGQPGIDPYFTGEDLPVPVPVPGQPDEREDQITPTGEDDIPGGFGPYDFPAALANYPTAAGRGGEKPLPVKREGGEEGQETGAASQTAGLSLLEERKGAHCNGTTFYGEF